MSDASGLGDVEVVVDVEVPGPGLDDFQLAAEVGDEPPEAVELTEEQALRASGLA